MKEFIFHKVASLQPKTDDLTENELFHRYLFKNVINFLGAALLKNASFKERLRLHLFPMILSLTLNIFLVPW